MVKVKFYDTADDAQLKFAVIIAKKDGRFIFCRHKERTTYEIPGGHREAKTLEEELHSEIEKIIITDILPADWTYPLIQPKLLAEAQKRGFM